MEGFLLPSTTAHSSRVDAQIVAKEVHFFVCICTDYANHLGHTLGYETVVIRLKLLPIHYALADEVLKLFIVDDRD
jgi:hypothetical protein